MSIVVEREEVPQYAQARQSNWLLAALHERDAAALAPHMEAVELPARRTLERRGKPIDFVYFIDRGVAAMSADTKSMRPVSVGLVGREGFIGAARVSAVACSQWDTQMQTPGAARRICAAAFDRAMQDNPGLRSVLLRAAHALTVQAMATARANARATLEERLVRWLLMVHDRSDGDEIHLTHETLSGMLGARRAGVSVAAKHLERSGMVALHRGATVILDRNRLEAYCNGAYGAAERHSLELNGYEPLRE